MHPVNNRNCPNFTISNVRFLLKAQWDGVVLREIKWNDIEHRCSATSYLS